MELDNLTIGQLKQLTSLFQGDKKPPSNQSCTTHQQRRKVMISFELFGYRVSIHKRVKNTTRQRDTQLYHRECMKAKSLTTASLRTIPVVGRSQRIKKLMGE